MTSIIPILGKNLNCCNMNYPDWLLTIKLNYNGSKCKLSQIYKLKGFWVVFLVLDQLVDQGFGCRLLDTVKLQYTIH